MSGNFRRPENLEQPAQHHDSHAQVQHRTLCGCGQELDVCTHGHCPRCGHRIEALQLVSVG